MSGSWAAGSDTRWRAFRVTILDRDRWTCTIASAGICTGVASEVDHVQPLSRGGAKYDPGNCRAACAPCNRARGNAAPEPQPQPRPHSSW